MEMQRKVEFDDHKQKLAIKVEAMPTLRSNTVGAMSAGLDPVWSSSSESGSGALSVVISKDDFKTWIPAYVMGEISEYFRSWIITAQ